MLNRFSDADAAPFAADPLALRAYTSRLLGQEPDLVLHGGGNTSLKATVTDFFGDPVDVLYIKGSGSDLSAIEPAGFAPVRMDVLKKLVARPALSDRDMVREQRAAMLLPDAPTPSVEALLHAIIPFAFVDHTHADAVVTLTNSPTGPARIEALYGDTVLVVPYVMPGFVLAQALYEQLRNVDLSRYEGMVLLHHGVFTWSDDAKTAYTRMIALVSRAEDYLRRHHAHDVLASSPAPHPPDATTLATIATLRRAVALHAGLPLVARPQRDPESLGFSALPDVAAIATRGPVTPDHIIRTKRAPIVITSATDDLPAAVAHYADEYDKYFRRHAQPGHKRLDPAPRWAIIASQGLVTFGRSAAEADIVADIAAHTIRCIQRAEALGGWRALPERDLFDMEYWDLEQAKLGKKSARPELQGQVALVTGAAHGIGRATATRLRELGAALVVVDKDPSVRDTFRGSDVLPIVADLTKSESVDQAVSAAITNFGGLDLLVSNAGSFPDATPLDALDDAAWEASLGLNLTSHQKLLRAAAPYLALGLSPAIVLVASKNVRAPGPGVAAYSVAKAGLTQLARVAALELAPRGIRVNVVHPDAVFDTALWTPEKVAQRARHYGLTPDQYKRRNLLGREIHARDVASVIARLLSAEWGATTGAQIPIDGGNDRTI